MLSKDGSMIRDESRRRVLHREQRVLVLKRIAALRARSRADPSRDDGVGILRDDTEQRPQTGAYWSKLFRAGLLVMK